MVVFKDNEIEAMKNWPCALRALADWHDVQATMGEPMGFDCSHHVSRYNELRAEADRIEKEWEDG